MHFHGFHAPEGFFILVLVLAVLVAIAHRGPRDPS